MNNNPSPELVENILVLMVMTLWFAAMYAYQVRLILKKDNRIFKLLMENKQLRYELFKKRLNQQKENNNGNQTAQSAL